MANLWSQDLHDAQRTSSSPLTPSGTLTYLGGFNGPDSTAGTTNAHIYDAPAEARPVCGGGYLYAPAGSHGVYALNRRTLAQVWNWTTRLNVDASPAYDPTSGYLIVGTTAGYLVKINTSTGVTAAEYNAGSPIRYAVAIVGSYAYCVTDAGALHKVRISDMTTGGWVYTAPGATVSQTPPSYSSTTSKWFFCTADLYVNAVNEADGSQSWRVKPWTGTQASDGVVGNIAMWTHGWPVVIEGKHSYVWVRLRTVDDRSGNGQFAFGRDVAAPSGSTTPGTPSEIQAWLNSNATKKHHFPLNMSDGSNAFTAAIPWNSVEDLISGNAYGVIGQMPAVKVWPNGDEVVYAGSRSWRTQSATDDGRWNALMGEFMLDASTFSGLTAGQFRWVQHPYKYGSGTTAPGGGAGYSYIEDETCPVTILGSQLWHSHWGAAEGVQIADRLTTNIGNDYTNPITGTILPPIMRDINTTVGANTTAHTAASGSLTTDGRSWTAVGGTVYWAYAGTQVPEATNSGKPVGSLGPRPRFTFASADTGDTHPVLYVVGNGGDIMAFDTTGSVPPEPTIGTIAADTTTPTQYGRIHLTFPVSNLPATTDTSLHYNANAPAGYPTTGVSVDALMLPPSASGDWSQAIVQPCWLDQPFTRTQQNSLENLYPTGAAAWKCRFAPTQTGGWSYKIRVSCAGVVVTSSIGTFTAGASTTHGFPKIATDTRYFQLSDGTTWYPRGANDSIGDSYATDTKWTGWINSGGAHPLNAIRFNARALGLAGTWGMPWTPVPARADGEGQAIFDWQSTPPGGNTTYSLKFTAAASGTQMQSVWGLQNGYCQIPVKPSTAYRIRVVVQTNGITGVGGGFSVGLGKQPPTYTLTTGLNYAGAPGRFSGMNAVNTAGAFQTIDYTYTTGASEYWLGNGWALWMGMEDATTAGTAYVASLSVKEGGTGPELSPRTAGEPHRPNGDAMASRLETIMARAEALGIKLLPTIIEKQDAVWYSLQDDGTVNPAVVTYGSASKQQDEFRAAFARRLHAQFGAYQSLWGWEFVNEADGGTASTRAARAMGTAFHQYTPRPLWTTSTGNTVWYPMEMWQYPEFDIAQAHDYVYGGLLKGQDYVIPDGTTLDSVNNALTITPNYAASSPLRCYVHEAGNWVVSCQFKATSVAGASSSLLLACDLPEQNHLDAAQGTYGWTTYSYTFTTLNDGNWHWIEAKLSSGNFTGTLQIRNITFTSPTGKVVRTNLGDNTLKALVRTDRDTAENTRTFGATYGPPLIAQGVPKPLVRGEFGINDIATGGGEIADLSNDTTGRWLHCLLFAELGAGGMTNQYWWTGNALTTNNLFGEYGKFGAFVDTLTALGNGNYVDIAATPSGQTNGTVNVYGQKDTANNRAHMWIRHANFNWYNAVHAPTAWLPGGVAGQILTGTVPFSGLANGTYTATINEFNSSGALSTSTQSVTVAGGSGSINLAALASTTTDAAVSLAPVTGTQYVFIRM